MKLWKLGGGICVACFLLFVFLWIRLATTRPNTEGRFVAAVEERTSAPEIERSYTEALKLAEVYQHGSAGVSSNSDLAMGFYLEALRKAPDVQSEGSCHMGVAALHENHLRTPDAIAALGSYLSALECGYEEAGLRIATIYANGMHPHYLPNKMEAMKLYKALEQALPRLHPWCKLAVRDMGSLRYDADAFAQAHSRALPDDIVNAALERLKARRGEMIPYKEPPPWIALEEPDDDLDLLEDARDIVERRLPAQRIRNDAQNVHDHAMLNAAKSNLSLGDSPSTVVAKTDFRACAERLRPTLAEEGRLVLDSLSATPHSRFDRSEQEVLVNVWQRIHAPENEERREDMLRVLKENLESGVESGYVVCSTGKIMRMLSTLEVLDPKAEIMRPEWAIKEEIGGKVGAVLQRKLSEADERTRSAYMSAEPTAKEEELAEGLRQRVRREVEQSCTGDYKGVIEPERLKLITDSMLEYI
jgi:hypothetical protein